MNDAQKYLHDIFGAFKHTSDYKDSSMMEIMCRKAEFEQHLDKMWGIYTRGNLQQVIEYKKQVQSIKDAGLVVMRSKSTGNHKIVFPK